LHGLCFKITTFEECTNETNLLELRHSNPFGLSSTVTENISAVILDIIMTVLSFEIV